MSLYDAMFAQYGVKIAQVSKLMEIFFSRLLGFFCCCHFAIILSLFWLKVCKQEYCPQHTKYDYIKIRKCFSKHKFRKIHIFAVKSPRTEISCKLLSYSWTNKKIQIFVFLFVFCGFPVRCFPYRFKWSIFSQMLSKILIKLSHSQIDERIFE